MRISVPAIAFGLLVILIATGAAGQQKWQSSCISCHEGLSGELAEPVRQWRTSVHAENRITCNACHGGDQTLSGREAMSPERGFVGAPSSEEVPQFCGKCHTGVREDYLKSAHGQALGMGGPQCVDCHGSHTVQLASPELINRDNCTVCHGFERAKQVRGALAATDKTIVRLRQRLEKLHRRGIATDEMEGSLFSARNTFHRLFHSVDVKKIRKRTGEVEKKLDAIRDHISRIEKRLSQRRKAGTLVVAALLLAALLFAYLRRTYSIEERKDS